MRSTATSTYLLEELRKPDNQTIWSEYVDRYRPLLLGFARRLGLTDADAQDVAQEALLTFADGYRNGSYDRDKGRLRAWLFGIARTLVIRRQRRPAREHQVADATGTGFFERIVDDGSDLQKVWDDQWEQAVLRQCLVEIRLEVEPKTFRAFELFARQGRPARDVATELGISENAVFGAKRRVLRRVRELLPEIEEIL